MPINLKPQPKQPAQWRSNTRLWILAAWLLAPLLLLIGAVEGQFLGSYDISGVGAVLFVGCLIVWTIHETLLVKPVPDEDRPPELRGPLPGGFRWGGWYYNAADPRAIAFDAKGHPIANLANAQNRPLLLMRVGGLLAGTAIIIVTAVAWLLE